MENLIILIPTYNEENNIPVLLSSIEKHCTKTNLLFIDDGSQDKTIEAITTFKENSKHHIDILQRDKKKGLGQAYKAGFNYVLQNPSFDYILQLDADMSHDPAYIPKMYEKIKHYPLVIGSRYIKEGDIKGWGIIRKIISYGGNFYARLILSSSIKDLTGGFNMWQKQTIEKININSITSEGYCFQIEMKIKTQWKKMNAMEIPIVFYDRVVGVSKINNNIIQEAIINVIKLSLNRKKYLKH